ncbi:hypothetical protein IAT40_004750 [Kwoniella sp. CBS 6097]
MSTNAKTFVPTEQHKPCPFNSNYNGMDSKYSIALSGFGDVQSVTWGEMQDLDTDKNTGRTVGEIESKFTFTRELRAPPIDTAATGGATVSPPTAVTEAGA